RIAKVRRPSPDELKADTIAIVLHGWHAHPPDGIDPGPNGFGGGFFDLCEGDGPAGVWREHEAHLRETARAWGWSPTTRGEDGRLRFYGEHLARPGSLK